jgi:chromosome segregation ATPase
MAFNKNQKKFFAGAAMTGALFCGSVTFADNVTQEGVARVETNLANSKVNVESYKQNLAIVSSNIDTISTAKTNISQRQEEVNKLSAADQEHIVDLKAKMNDLNTLLKSEKEKQAKEAEHVAILEKTLAKLKDNQVQREQVVQSYSEQLKTAEQEIQLDQSHLDTLKATGKELAKHQQEIDKEQRDWLDKKKGYEAEVSRWEKEVDRNQKLKGNFSALANQE